MGRQHDLFSPNNRNTPAQTEPASLPAGVSFNGTGEASTPKVIPVSPTPLTVYTSSKPTRSVYVRKTSASAFRAIVEDGTLGRMQRKVYGVLYESGPLTANEINRACLEEGEVAPSYHKRLSELERKGVVRRVGIRACKVSGNDCDTWDVTDALPSKPKVVVQRTHTIYAVGESPQAALDAFTYAVGWEPVEGTLKTLEKPPRGLSWGFSFTDKSTNDTVTVGGDEVPGGFTLTYFK